MQFLLKELSWKSSQPDHGLVWKFKKVTKVNTELFQEVYVKKIPVKLQHNAGNFWGVIKFTRQFDLELQWKFKKVA